MKILANMKNDENEDYKDLYVLIHWILWLRVIPLIFGVVILFIVACYFLKKESAPEEEA
jgi:heme/copper-type cytochrome/quinol oxidase subunit 2